MRDVIWTIIAVWLVYKLVEMFRAVPAKNTTGRASEVSGTKTSEGKPQPGDVKDAVRRHMDRAGEYVDFEEVKEDRQARS